MRKVVCVLMLPMLAMLLVGCLGPKPVVQDYSVHAPAAGSSEPYKVDVTLANAGPGGGTVELEVELVERTTGSVLAQEMRDVDLQKDETVHTELDLTLPASMQDLDPQEIEVHVDAHYPIE